MTNAEIAETICLQFRGKFLNYETHTPLLDAIVKQLDAKDARINKLREALAEISKSDLGDMDYGYADGFAKEALAQDAGEM